MYLTPKWLIILPIKKIRFERLLYFSCPTQTVSRGYCSVAQNKSRPRVKYEQNSVRIPGKLAQNGPLPIFIIYFCVCTGPKDRFTGAQNRSGVAATRRDVPPSVRCSVVLLIRATHPKRRDAPSHDQRKDLGMQFGTGRADRKF